jgi:hypothetical protein
MKTALPLCRLAGSLPSESVAFCQASQFFRFNQVSFAFKPDPGPPGASSRCTGVQVNTAGLHASAAMGLSGRLEYDSSNHGLC